MKLYKILSVMIMATLYLACSKDNVESEISQPSSETENYMFIKSITDLVPTDYEKPDEFYYEDDKLIFVRLYNCSGEVILFEYNNDGKVIESYDSTKYGEFELTAIDEDNFKKNSSKTTYEYDSNNLLIRRTTQQSITSFIYDNEDRVISIQSSFISSGENLHRQTIKYGQDGKVESLTALEVYDDEPTVYTFEFDNKKNSTFPLFKQFGIFNFYTCRGSLEPYGTPNYLIFENNVTRTYRDGELFFDASYKYNEEDYPIEISYSDYSDGISEVNTIDYLN